MSTKQTNASDIEAGLRQFCGSERRYPHWTKLLDYTEGVQWLAEQAGAYWLIDLIASHQTLPRVRSERFQVWQIERQGEQGAIVTCHDDLPGSLLSDQCLEYTDFPLQQLKLYVCGDRPRVLMLPSEY